MTHEAHLIAEEYVARGGLTRALRWLCITAALLTACVSGRAADGERTSAEAQARAAAAGRIAPDFADEGLTVDELSAQNLAVGECGLFLWSRSAPVALVFFSSSLQQIGIVSLEGEVRRLPRTAASGRENVGHFEEQTFLSRSREVSVSTEIEWGEPLNNGVRVPSGVLRIAHDSGWETVVPVAGLVGCRPT